ncbi:MAG: transpeptidase family protein, partial [Sinomicrobium sp.]|nr:transpeptidase family protein [Sinomicrobium sp.]
ADGEKYRAMAKEQTIKNFVIQPNRGNLYSDDGSLLATSVTRYDIRFDALTPDAADFKALIKPLSDSLSIMFGKPSSHYEQRFAEARKNKNRYLLIARDLGYTEYMRIKSFPLFNLDPYKGGIIVEQNTEREHPFGTIAERSIGYERVDDSGYVTRVGLEGAFSDYLRGKEGRRLKQKIAKGQWKPITDYNEIEPKDGYDVVSTININIQDIAHHALLEQLQKYKADHGCAVVMEVKSGEIKAIVNLGRTEEGRYYEERNYAVWESHEPGSVFKLMTVMAALEDKVVDTSYVVDTEQGILTFYNKYKVRDSRHGGYGKISLSKAFEVSSNTGIVKVIDKFYGKQPEKFVNRLYNMGINNQLNLSVKGEGRPIIPHPKDKDRWSGIALQWMAYGYGVSLTPLQTLTFYNAVANDGKMIKPRLIREVRDWNKTVRKFDKEVLNSAVCSRETLAKVRQMLCNVIEKEHGTGHGLYMPGFSMAGKTGTCQKDYKDKSKLNYISTFAGFFPAENPRYSCIVVIHEPDKSVGYYGADVSGPVFKSIAQKIYTNTPVIDTVDELNTIHEPAEKSYQAYYEKAQQNYHTVPDVTGMSGMDAVSLLENLGFNVKVIGIGKVKEQSVKSGEKIQTPKTIVLQLS